MSAHAAGLARRRLRGDLHRRDDGSTQSGFSISDISPMIQYGQAGSTSSPWIAGYASQSDGYDETLHYTSTSNSTLSFNVTATSISLLVPSFASCAATMSINGSAPVPACATSSAAGDLPFTVSNLPAGTHAVQWSSGAVPSGAQVVFWGVQCTRPTRGSNITIDDSYNAGGGSDGPVKLQYAGNWQHDSGGQGAAGGSFQKTLATTSSQGAQVSFSSSGWAVYIYGPVGPDFGTASVSLNGQVVAPLLNLTSTWPLDYGLLWFQTGLNPGSRSDVTLTNLENKKMGVDFFILSAETDLISSLNLAPATIPFTGTLAGKLVLFMLIPLVAVSALGLLVWLLIRRRRRQRAAQASRNSHRGSGAAILRTDGLVSPSEYSEKGTYNTDYASARTGGFSPYSGGGPSSAGSSGGAAIWDGRSASRASGRGGRDRDLEDGEGEVFVSYESAKSQRLSDRWNRNSATTRTASPVSPATEGSPRLKALSPQPSVSGLSDGRPRAHLPGIAESTGGTVENLEGTGDSSGTGSASHYRIWSAIQSLLAAPPSVPGSAIPATAPPAYSPEDTNATWHSDLNGSRLGYAADTSRGSSPAVSNPAKSLSDISRGGSPQQGGPSSGPNGFPSAFDEKAQQLLAGQGDEAGGGGPQRPSPTQASRTRLSRWTDRASSIAPSSIISMFGAPPSVRDRDSVFTAYTGAANSPSLPVPPMPARPAPTVDTSFRRGTTAAGVPISALNPPVVRALSRETDRSGNGSGHSSPRPGPRSSSRSVRSVSSTSSRGSAASARPDSAIMPI